MLTKDCNFRDIYHKVCFIECADQIQNLKKVFNVSKKDNGVLAYGYIDHEDGFTFEVLTTGKLENGVLSFRASMQHRGRNRLPQYCPGILRR